MHFSICILQLKMLFYSADFIFKILIPIFSWTLGRSALLDLYSTRALAGSFLLHQKHHFPHFPIVSTTSFHSQPLSSFVFLPLGLALKPRPLCVFLFLTASCMFCGYLKLSMSWLNPHPFPLCPKPLPVLNDESQPTQSPEAKAWPSLGLLPLSHPTNNSSTTLMILEPAWAKPLSSLAGTTGVNVHGSSCLHSCPSSLLSPLQPEGSLKYNMTMSLPA